MSFLVSSDYFCFKVCFSDIKISTSASFLVVFSWNWYLFLFLLTWNTMRYVSRSHWSPFKDQSCLLIQSIGLCPYIRELKPWIFSYCWNTCISSCHFVDFCDVFSNLFWLSILSFFGDYDILLTVFILLCRMTVPSRILCRADFVVMNSSNMFLKESF